METEGVSRAQNIPRGLSHGETALMRYQRNKQLSSAIGEGTDQTSAAYPEKAEKMKEN